MDVAKDIQLLRRTGPYQLALLSRLRRDDLIMPVMKAVWHHNLHSSCPDGRERADMHVRHVHWRPVAESLLTEVLGSVNQQSHWEPMLSQLHTNEMRKLSMPGSAAVMQILMPQLQDISLKDQDCLQGLQEQTARLAAVAQRCMPAALWETLKAVGRSVAEGGIGLLGHDVITEIAARACANVQEWPGNEAFESVRSHLERLILCLMRNISPEPTDDAESQMYDSPKGQETEDSHAVRALIPAVAAVLLLPISQQVASLQMQFPTPTSSWAEYLDPLLDPFPAGTWKMVRDRGIQAALELHASDLEKSLLSTGQARENMQDTAIQKSKLV